MARWLRQRICAQQTWVQLLLVPVLVVGGGRKGIRPKLLLCTSKSPTLVLWNQGVDNVDFDLCV